MKTLGRIFIILAVFAALSGLMVVAVNLVADFDGTPPIRPGGDAVGVRPEGGDQNRPERGERDERDGFGGGSRWMFGMVKNTVVIAVLVTVIALPKGLAKKKRKRAAVSSADKQVE
jgi:hypothetical protein